MISLTDENKNPVPPISSPADFTETIQERIRKVVRPIFEKVLQEAGRDTMIGVPTIKFIWRPNNYRLSMPFDAKTFIPAKTHHNVVLTVSNFGTKFTLKNFNGTTIMIDKNRISCIYSLKHLGKKVWYLIEANSIKDIDDRCKERVETIETRCLENIKSFVEIWGGKPDYEQKKWVRFEDDFHGEDYVKSIPEDAIITDTYFKKLYPKGIEFKGKEREDVKFEGMAHMKNFVSNRIVEEIAPEIAKSIDNLGNALDKNLEKIAEANLNTSKTMELLGKNMIAMSENTKFLAEQINVHIPAIKKIGENADRLGDGVDRLGDGVDNLTTIVKKLDKTVSELKPKKKKIKKIVERPRRKTPSDSICAFCNKRMPWDEKRKRWVCEKDNFIRIWDD